METYNAEIVTRSEDKFLKFKFKDGEFEIPLTEDDPKKVKSVFNELAKRLKSGLYKLNFQGNGNDLFTEVSKEYISQLNKELEAAFDEMRHFNLVDKKK